MADLPPVDASVLPRGIRSRFVDGVNGLRMHVLEAGEGEGRPLLLLLHGFPELAYSWRKVMPELAAAGFHVVAPDQRGYGRTTGWSADYDGDLAPFRPLNLVRDALGLVRALGHDAAAGVFGHDFGSPIAAWCALLRPDVFRSVALMSAPFTGPPGRTSTRRWRGSTRRGSITSGTTRRAAPTRRCAAGPAASMLSCAPTTTTRAPTGRATGPSRWRAGRRANWR